MSDRAAFIERLPKHSVGAEIGVWKGDFSAALLEAVEPEKLVLVDPWEVNDDYTNYSATVNTTQAKLDSVYDQVIERFFPSDKVEVMRARSTVAAAYYDSEFDWVYIDARHDDASVAADLRAWWPLVKPGGFLSGHDYDLDSVKRAVDGFAEPEGVAVEIIQDVNFIITKPQTGERDEHVPSASPGITAE